MADLPRDGEAAMALVVYEEMEKEDEE